MTEGNALQEPDARRPGASVDGELSGWVLWRDDPGQRPAFRRGTLSWRDGLITGFDEKAHPSHRRAEDEGRALIGGDGAEIDPDSVFVIPGLVDLHSHLAIAQGPQSSDVIRSHAWNEITAGVLALREPGSPVKVSPGELPFGRPLVISAGRHIALEKRYNRGLAVELPSDPRQGPVASRAKLVADEARRQAASGDGWVKLVGDWVDRSAGDQSDLKPLWTRAELLAAVEAAHQAGARVAVHTFGSDIIDDLLDAGVDSIEHGTGMTRAQMDRARAAGVVVVPTLIQVLKFPQFAASAQSFPKYARTMTDLYDQRKRWFADLLASGILLLPGSDAGGYQAHGALIDEMQQMAAWGMTPSDVLDAATWKARDYLGLPSLEAGAPADAVVYRRDPRADSGVWSQPALVVAAGHMIRP